MMNLLIVDDEHHIVNYMVALTEENYGNILEIYKAYSSTEALKILADTKIDIILLDIQMPGMTGLELAKIISETWPNCRIIFLTAFDSFDYIYSANDLPHTSYLLKTEPDQVILSTLSQAINDIQEEQNQKAMLDDTLKRNKYLSHLLMQHSLRILQSGMPIESLYSENAFMDIDSPLDIDKPVYLMYMNIRHSSFKDYHPWDYSQCLQYLHLAEYHSSNKFNCFLLQMDNENGLWFFQCRENTDFGVSNPISFLKNMADSMISDLEKINHRRIILLLYPEPVNCSDIHHTSYYLQTALEKMDFTLILSTVMMCHKNTVSDKQELPTAEEPNIESLLNEAGYCLTHGNQQDYFSILDQLQEICQTKQSMHSLFSIRIYQTIALDIMNYIDSYNLQEILSTNTAIYPLYYVQNFTDWNQAFQYLHTCSQNIFRIIESKGASRNSSTIEKIQKYIQSNIHTQINLSGIAAVVNYNETYVSRLFKQHTGMKISDYILQERLAKAKQLLSTTEQNINAIAENCGFDSIHYFSYTFKKNVGMSPSDYRRNSKA